LSALAAIDEDSLVQLREKLWPHELRRDPYIPEPANFSPNVQNPATSFLLEQADSRDVYLPQYLSTSLLGDRGPLEAYINLEQPSFSPVTMDTRNSSEPTERGSVDSSYNFFASGSDEIMRNSGEPDINRAQFTTLVAEQVGVMDSDCNEFVSGTTEEMTSPLAEQEAAEMDTSSDIDTSSVSQVASETAVNIDRVVSEVSESLHSELLGTVTPADTRSHFLRTLEVLISVYGENTDLNLKDDHIIRAIEAGDSFLRKDVVDFISSYLWEHHDSIWHDSVLSPPLNGTLTEKLFKSFHCAELLVQRSAVDPIRLLITRVLLYCYYEQKLSDTQGDLDRTSQCSRGRTTSSVALDKLLEETYQSKITPQDKKTWDRRRRSLANHKQIGKRWAMLINYIGAGFLLICDPELAKDM
jgi:hypothetical protein